MFSIPQVATRVAYPLLKGEASRREMSKKTRPVGAVAATEEEAVPADESVAPAEELIKEQVAVSAAVVVALATGIVEESGLAKSAVQRCARPMMLSAAQTIQFTSCLRLRKLII